MKIGTLCYVRKADKTLMLLGGPHKPLPLRGVWNGLGGKLEHGESPEECVIREVKEESGLTIKNPKLVGIITFPAFALSGDQWQAYVYIAHNPQGEIQESREGKLQWVPTNELVSLKVQEGDRIFIPLLDSDKFWSAKIVYDDDGKLLKHSLVFH